MDTEKQPGLKIAQIFLLQAVFAHREDALSLPINHQIGELNLEAEIKTGVNPDGSAGIVTLTVKTRDEDNPEYRFAIEMAALVEEVPAERNLSPAEYFEMNGSALLYPFVREVVASLTWKGRFGPIWLKPINLTIGNQKESLDSVGGGRQPQ
jgi:preprotein translocase subunit SecB